MRGEGSADDGCCLPQCMGGLIRPELSTGDLIGQGVKGSGERSDDRGDLG